MPKHLRSFLIRCWELDEGEQRIEVEHIQSGKRIVAASAEIAVAWIGAGAGHDPVSLTSAPRDVHQRPEDERTGAKGGDVTDRGR